MNVRDIIKFLYWDVMTFVVGVIIFYCLSKDIGPSGMIQLFTFYFIIAFLYVTIHIWLGHKIFKEKMTLADKIMTCKLRMEHGLNYCVKCPDSYKCPTDLK